MAVPCHEPTENQRRYPENERKNRAHGALEPPRLAHAHHLAQDQTQIERRGMNKGCPPPRRISAAGIHNPCWRSRCCRVPMAMRLPSGIR